MVCGKCESKLGTLATTDMTGRGGRAVNENKLLSQKNRFAPYTANCKSCRSRVHQRGSNYCQQCAYKKGICSMCGIKILDTKLYKQSSK
ncbi:cysteine-rich PDZ-binding protein-like protein [Cladochytrium replicatum]|nr:cysteine-rich PDZ-binding protein-like protein [Cladochytrium replicatum]